MLKDSARADYRRALVAAPVLVPALLLSHTKFELWYAGALIAALVAMLVLDGRVERRALRRVKTGLCASCGYDLRFSPDYCPECGTPLRPPEPHQVTISS